MAPFRSKEAVPSKKAARMVWQHYADESGHLSTEQITLAVVRESLDVLDVINQRLMTLISLVSSLGNDGIHELIREYAYRAGKAKQRRLQRARLARKKLREARKVA